MATSDEKALDATKKLKAQLEKADFKGLAALKNVAKQGNAVKTETKEEAE